MSSLHAQQCAYFKEGLTLGYAARISALHQFDQALRQYEERLVAALYQDFQKSAFESFTTEFSMLYEEIRHAQRNLKKWMRPQRVRTNWINWPAHSAILREPLGVNLIIGAWNYPVLLLLQPAVSALAAGNTAVLKPSENAPAVAAVIEEMINTNFESGHLVVVQADAKQTQQLLTLRWDHIFYTGSTKVGQIVYEAAAKHLTPVTLELGGKSPAIITASANIPLTAKRLIWGKFLNAGQTCVAPDYVLVHESVREAFIHACISELKRHNYTLGQNHYCQIINHRHFDRLIALLDPEKIVFGGQSDRDTRFIAPTIMAEVTLADAVMQEEIFGPILPLMTFDTLENAVTQVKALEKPLAAYVFSTLKKEYQKVLSDLSFGGGAVNDVVMHLSNPNLPFGGVGHSGIGAYHGTHGLDCFSHRKSVLYKKNWFEAPLKYPPLSHKKLNWIKKFMK
ncbi:MAG: aldehyde dehydrogenase [Bacteroidetes bacterium]|nr:aldehyde dehydrogenase [Bacteroidota bacterium]